jgi:hypothetical protein
MVAAVLDALGVKFGAERELLPANQGNLAGYFENRRVLEINDKLAAANSLNWRTLPAVAARKKIEGVEQYLIEVEGVASNLATDPAWGVKDPRLSFFLPYWKSAAPSSSVIICVRRPEAVALSLNVRNDLSFAYGAALWELYTLAALKNSRRMPRVALVYEQLLEDPAAAVRKIVAAVPELTEIDFSEETLAAAAARIKGDLDHSDEQELDLGFLTDKQLKLYDRLASGTLAVSRKDEEAPVSFELARLEAGHQLAKAATVRANEEIGNLRTKLDNERSQQDAFLNRVRDLAQTFTAEKPVDSSAEAVVTALRNALRRLGELPPGFVPTTAVEEVNKLKDKQIGWFQAELESAGNRARSGLDQLQEALLESVALKVKAAESERMRLLLEGTLKNLQVDHERVRREHALLEVNLETTREREADAQDELRKLNRANSDMRSEMLAAQLLASQLGKQLAEKDRDLATLAQRNEAATTSLTALKEAHTHALQERDHFRNERNALATERSRLEAQANTAGKEVNSLRQELQDIVAERSRLGAQADAAAQEVASLRKELREVDNERNALATERSRLEAQANTAGKEVNSLRQELQDIVAERSRLGAQADAAAQEVASLRKELREVDAERSRLEALTESATQELSGLRKQLQDVKASASAPPPNAQSEKALATTRIALKNATELVASLEAEIAELKARAISEPERDGDGLVSVPVSSAGQASQSTSEMTKMIERLQVERDALQKGLLDARKAQAAAEASAAAARKAGSSSQEHGSSAMRDRLGRQLAAMQELVASIDVLLAPKIGGRFWIPVRKIRVKLVQLRQILDIETVRARRPS